MSRIYVPPMSKPVLFSVVTAFVVSLAAVGAADEYDDLAKTLAGLRGEVEGLSGKLAENKSELRDEVRALARQKAELSMELDREQVRLQKLRQTISKKKEKVDAELAKSKALVPTFNATATKARAYIKSSLPFRIEERLSEIDKVEEQLKAGLLSPQKAVARMWAALEDEFRMARDSGVFRQTIQVEGKEQLADVVRIGMVLLYYRTSDEQYGHAVKKDGKWGFEPLASPEDQKRVAGLFDSFKKQIRQGYFELPGAFTAARQ